MSLVSAVVSGDRVQGEVHERTMLNAATNAEGVGLEAVNKEYWFRNQQPSMLFSPS